MIDVDFKSEVSRSCCNCNTYHLLWQ